ncbi:hypothetical protein D3C84_910460 [compost metagenome]
MAFAIGITLFALAHGLALAETIAPAFGVARILEVTRHVFPELAGDHPGGLPATAATVVVAVGERWWITPGDQVFVGGFTATEQHQHTQDHCRTLHFCFPAESRSYKKSRSGFVSKA